MRTPLSPLRAAPARRLAPLFLALLVATVLLIACNDPLPSVGDAPNDPGCSPQESATENDAADLHRARLLRLILLVGQAEVAIRSSADSLSSSDAPLFPLSPEHRALLWTNAMEIDAILTGIEAVLDEMPDQAQELRSQRQPLRLASIAWADWLTQLVERGEEAFSEQPQFFDGPPIRQARDLFNELLAELYSLDAQSACPGSPERAAADGARANPAVLRMLMLINQLEVVIRSSERSLSSDDVPLFPLTAEHRALLWTDAMEIEAILTGIEAALNEMPEGAQELRSLRQPLMLASIAWAAWLTQLVERGEEAFDEQPDGGLPIRQARELFDELLSEQHSLDARSAAPAILRMLMLISLMESEVRSICAVTGCPVRSVDQRGVARAPLTAAEQAVLSHAAARLVILRGLAWDLQSENADQSPQALLADLEAAPVPLDELTSQWFWFARRGAGGAPDTLSQPHITYGILGAQVTVFNVYARHLSWL